MIGYAKLALTALEASGLLMKLAVAAGLVTAVLIAYGVWHHKVYQSGVDDTIAAIAREDARFINRALAARNRWKECHDQGRGWDQSTGRCL